MKIGFIGLGNMGGPMAHNLVKAGHHLLVFDVNEEAIATAVQAGAQAVDSAAQMAAAKPQVIFTMLPQVQHVKSVYLGEEGVIAHGHPDTLLVDCSTIDPHSARLVASAAEERGITLIDAPVSGGTKGAQEATLTFMVGGPKAAFEQVTRYLQARGKSTGHCGQVGNGRGAKGASNMLLAISMIGVAEAMNLGVALGMEPEVLAQIINTSSGRCWSSDTNNPYPGVLEGVPASRGYEGGFGSALMLKDLGLAMDAAGQAQQPVMLGALAKQLYQQLCNLGHEHLDFSAIMKLYQQEV